MLFTFIMLGSVVQVLPYLTTIVRMTLDNLGIQANSVSVVFS